MQQPYSAFAKTMLEIQHYPELRRYPGGPLKRPYDVTAHTLGIQLGVDTYQVDQPFQAVLAPIDSITPVSGDIRGSGSYWLFSTRATPLPVSPIDSLKRDAGVLGSQWLSSRREGYPVGTLMTRSQGDEAEFRELLEALPLEVHRVEKWPHWLGSVFDLPESAFTKASEPPRMRVGLDGSWNSTNSPMKAFSTGASGKATSPPMT